MAVELLLTATLTGGLTACVSAAAEGAQHQKNRKIATILRAAGDRLQTLVRRRPLLSHPAVWERKTLPLPALFAQQCCGMRQEPGTEVQEGQPGAQLLYRIVCEPIECGSVERYAGGVGRQCSSLR